jgi:hypothetical protein
MVLHPFRDARGEGFPQKVGPVVEHQFLQAHQPDHALDVHDLVARDMELFDDLRLQVLRRARADLQAHDLPPAAALERGLEFAHEVLGLFLHLQIAVAQDAEGAGPGQFVAREQRPHVQQQKLLQRQEPRAAIGRGQAHETVDLAGDRQQRLQRPPVPRAPHLQRQRETFVRDEGKRVRRVDGQRRQDREDAGEELLLEVFLVGGLQRRARHHRDPLAFQVLPQRHPRGLLMLHQAPGIGVDQLQLLRRRATVIGGSGVPLQRQFPEARHAHGVEFVEVARADRHEAHPLQKRHAGVLGLLQHAPVEGEPAQFPVEEPPRATGLRIGKDGRLGQRSVQEIGETHGMLP